MRFITCQHEWVQHCLSRYRCEPPKGFHYEDAHYPLSQKQGETNTVRLWFPDHIVQGVLQTLQTRYPCIMVSKKVIERRILEEIYPEYLNLYDEAYSLCQRHAGSIGGKKGGKIMGERCVEQKLGIHDPKHKEKCRENSRRNGRISGPKATAQRWESLIDGFVSHAPGVAKHNRHNGWDPDARIRIS